MTTNHRPTLEGKRGKVIGIKDTIAHARALPQHQKLKYRRNETRVDDSVAAKAMRDLQQDLLLRESVASRKRPRTLDEFEDEDELDAEYDVTAEKRGRTEPKHIADINIIKEDVGSSHLTDVNPASQEAKVNGVNDLNKMDDQALQEPSRTISLGPSAHENSTAALPGCDSQDEDTDDEEERRLMLMLEQMKRKPLPDATPSQESILAGLSNDDSKTVPSLPQTSHLAFDEAPRDQLSPRRDSDDEPNFESESESYESEAESRQLLEELQKIRNERHKLENQTRPRLETSGWRNNTAFSRQPHSVTASSKVASFTTDTINSEFHKDFLKKYVR